MSKKIIFIISFLAIFCFVFNFGLSDAKAITVTELQARIAEIQAQIAQLQQQLAGIQKEAPPAEIKKETPGWCFNFYQSLAYGDKGEDVKALQIALQKEGIYKGLITSYFDSLTLSAVMSFQVRYAKNILNPWGLIKGTGYVGRTTKAKLNEIYGCKEEMGKFITLTSPNGGEKWEVGANVDITWRSKGVERVEINFLDYTNKESKFIPIYFIEYPSGGTIYAPSGRTIVIVPNLLGDKYKILIKEVLPGNLPVVSDESDNYFSVILPVSKSITVISPNGGESWRMGDTYRINWKTKGLTNEHWVYIFVEAYDINKNRIYYKGQPKNIVTMIPATRGYYDWKIPLNFDEEFENIPTYYKLSTRVGIGLHELPLLDSSDDYFRINFPAGMEKEVPFITVISPNGGEKWMIGNTYNITWFSSQSINKIIISLHKPNWWVRDLAVNIPNTGSYSWTIPSDIESGDYIIVVRELRTGVYGVYDKSDNVFNIVGRE